MTAYLIVGGARNGQSFDCGDDRENIVLHDPGPLNLSDFLNPDAAPPERMKATRYQLQKWNHYDGPKHIVHCIWAPIDQPPSETMRKLIENYSATIPTKLSVLEEFLKISHEAYAEAEHETRLGPFPNATRMLAGIIRRLERFIR